MSISIHSGAQRRKLRGPTWGVQGIKHLTNLLISMQEKRSSSSRGIMTLCKVIVMRKPIVTTIVGGGEMKSMSPHPGTSGYSRSSKSSDREKEKENPEKVAERRAEDMIREAEAAKVQIMDIQGKHNFNNQYMHSVLVDESFMMVAAHIDDSLKKRIEEGEYVDFARLLPRVRVSEEHSNRFEWVSENGCMFLMPVTDRARDKGQWRWKSLLSQNRSKHLGFSLTFIQGHIHLEQQS